MSIEEFIQLIVATRHKAFMIKEGRLRKKNERELQKYIVRYAWDMGYKAVNEDILRTKTPSYQPLMDIVIEIDEDIHGAELKILDIDGYKPFNGLDQALAYSLNGVDYSWLIHYIPYIPYDFSMRVESHVMNRIFKTFGITQVGFLMIDVAGLKYKITPTKPIKYDEQSKQIRGKILRLLQS